MRKRCSNASHVENARNMPYNATWYSIMMMQPSHPPSCIVMPTVFRYKQVREKPGSITRTFMDGIGRTGSTSLLYALKKTI